MNALILTALIAACDPIVPGDMDQNGVINSLDVDLLVTEIARHGQRPHYDLDCNGVVNRGDLDEWLTLAGARNGMSGPYLYGDANLDGWVNAKDLNVIGRSWGQSGAVWSGWVRPGQERPPAGDFSADGRVDAADLNLLAINWQQSVPYRAVPEPGGLVLLIWGMVYANRHRQTA